MPNKDRRTHVRGRMAFKVSFTVLDPEEYDRLKLPQKEKISLSKERIPSDWGKALEFSNDPINQSLINFIMKLDEKLDLIIDSMAKEKKIDKPYYLAVGEDISGTGMKIISDRKMTPDQVVNASFSLFKEFFLHVDVYGRVTRVAELEGSGPDLFEIGIEFLNLKADDREKIISIVFKTNREAIREFRQQA